MRKRRSGQPVQTSPTWDRIIAGIDDEELAVARLQADIVDQVYAYLRQKNWTQKQLADALGKSPSEINKWLKVGHNMTMKTVVKLTAALGGDILQTPLRSQARRHAKLEGDRFEAEHYRATLASFTANFSTTTSVSIDLETAPTENATKMVQDGTTADVTARPGSKEMALPESDSYLIAA